MNEAAFYAICIVVLLLPLAMYILRTTSHEQKARHVSEQNDIASGPRAQHPHIDVSNCIGCQGCTTACPEGGVLGMLGGKAAVIRPQRCIGHGMCAEACPVGAIQLVLASPGVSADLPYLTPHYETNIANLFIAGELGGLALIKNAVLQGRSCVDTIASRFSGLPQHEHIRDVIIVGAGPAGISASLRAIEKNLDYITIERGSIGGAVAKYPRQKLVMASRVELPIYGVLSNAEFSKEQLLDLWANIAARPDFRASVGENVESVRRREDGVFCVRTSTSEYLSRAVILAIGRSGNPRKLGIKGEDLPKVMYRLLEADHYAGRDILIVGGGDSAVEAAIGLARQRGNRVTISYRRSEFTRIKERNAKRLAECMRAGTIQAAFRSTPVEFTENTAVLDVSGERREIPNDFVWIFAGGEAPNDFLKSIGIAFGSRELTQETAACDHQDSTYDPVRAAERQLR